MKTLKIKRLFRSIKIIEEIEMIMEQCELEGMVNE